MMTDIFHSAFSPEAMIFHDAFGFRYAFIWHKFLLPAQGYLYRCGWAGTRLCTLQPAVTQRHGDSTTLSARSPRLRRTARRRAALTIFIAFVPHTASAFHQNDSA